MLKKLTDRRTPHTRHRAGGRADRRGSAIVLVLVSIVLMAILAATLLQVTRFERIPRPVSNIDIVVESVIEEIANQLTDDILDNDGNMFNVRITVGNNANGGGDEPWDFPWTIPSTGFGREAEDINGNKIPVFGGAMDDSYLAASSPDFRTTIPANSVSSGSNGTYGIWRKISNLSGLYLGGAGGDADLSGLEEPNEYPVNSLFSPLNKDSNIVIQNNATLVDADGDGIGDSRWEWAPIRQIGTTRYVMAVRVIDLSGRVDLNVAMGRTLATDNSAPRGDGPTEIEGNTFMTETAAAGGMNQGAVQNEWLRVLNYRLTGAVPPPNRIGNAPTLYDNNQANPAFPSRRHYWEEGASRLGPNFVRSSDVGTGAGFDYGSNSTFKLVDAIELLQRNGLNSSTRTTLEELMPTAMRDGAAEDTFVNNASVTGYNWNQRSFWENDIRKQVSPWTGAMAAIRPVKFDEKRDPKLDINVAVSSAQGRNEMRLRITKLLTSNFGSAGQLVGRYPHISSPFDFADIFTVNAADYIDRDNRITTLNNEAGFECLPFITEVYTQRLYQVTTVTPPAAPATTDTVEWTGSNVQGYVIEIGNPFARFDGGRWVGRPVSLESVWLRLVDGGTPIELSSITGVPNELKPGEVLYLYRDSAGNTTNPNMDQLKDYHTTTGSGNFTKVHTAEGPVFPLGRRSARISLHAELQDNAGTAASWAYSACEIQLSNSPQNESAAPGAFGVGDQGYVLTGYQGIGQGLAMMTVTATPKSANARGFGDDTTSLDKPGQNCAPGMPGMREARRQYIPELAKQDKANAPVIFSSLKDQQIVWHDNPRQRMQWIGDILQMPLIGPDFRSSAGNGSLMAEAFYAAAGNSNNLTNGVEALLLPYKKQQDATIPVVNNAGLLPVPGSTFGVYNVPHAILIMEQFTTFSPAYDGQNGDNGTSGFESIFSPDQNELLVPGKINLNTASYATLVRALPYTNLATREAIATAIIQRREDLQQLGNHNIGANGVPGIAYTGSLYENIERLTPGAFGVAGFTGNASRDGSDTRAISGARVDWNDYEKSPGDFDGLEDGVIDDREEEIMLAKWLSEVGETRSDVFAAYIVVQGYPAENFKAGAIESARLIVIFSRAGVQDGDDRAVEIGRFRFK